MIRRIAVPLFMIGVLFGLACIDMSAPKGAASISALLLPSPSVVVGDTMRDSTGAAAPLRVIAYDADDKPITDLDAQFFVLDSVAAAHIANKNIVVGDKQGSIRLVGQVGSVQTTTVTVPITVAPKTLALSGKVVDTLFTPLVARDTTSASTGSTPIAVTLKGLGDTASLGFIVKYQLMSAPATTSGSTIPAVYLGDDAGKPSTADTTDASGASRKVYVRSWLLADPTKVDSAVVVISTAYKGKPVAGSPIRVVLPIKVKIVLQ